MKGKTVSLAENPLQNRLRKNYKKLKSYITKNELEAFRVYHKDIPEYPYLIDIYKDCAVVYEQGKRITDEEIEIRDRHFKEVEMAIQEVFAIPPEKQHFKTRSVQKGSSQYGALNENSENFFAVQEKPFRFLVNLERYLDTGLFLDHRPLRQHLHKVSSGKKVLNLFCYTGSLSVASALGEGEVTSIDMSRTYLDWARKNFTINKIEGRHRFIQADVLQELDALYERGEKFDIIILDPPSFSNSKRMEEELDIQRDHVSLVKNCMGSLNREGVLYFSTNKKKFELDPGLFERFSIKKISQWTVPQDFHGTYIHEAYEIRHLSD